MKWANEALLKLSVLFGAVLLFATAQVRAQGKLPVRNPLPSSGEPTQQLNQRLEESRNSLSRTLPEPTVDESRIGPDDLLEITVFEAPELNRSLRVSANGEISLDLLGPVRAGGLTPRQLESVLQELLRRTYMKDPHVGVFVRELQSHPVSVVGAVKKPGVFQIRGTKSVLELLSMAEGLADDAGDTVLGFVLKSNENISVLQALALAEGLTRTSSKSQARIIRTDQGTDKRIEIPVDLGKILAGKAPDPLLQPKDIIYVPDSSAKSAFYRGAEAVLSTATGVVIYRR